MSSPKGLIRSYFQTPNKYGHPVMDNRETANVCVNPWNTYGYKSMSFTIFNINPDVFPQNHQGMFNMRPGMGPRPNFPGPNRGMHPGQFNPPYPILQQQQQHHQQQQQQQMRPNMPQGMPQHQQQQQQQGEFLA